MPTIKDIAKLANVSYGTVSNVINKRGNVSLKKIKQVEQAAAELGYYINETASSLRQNKKMDVALIIPTLDNYLFRKIYHLLLIKLEELNLKLSLFTTNFNPELEDHKLKYTMATNKFVIVYSCKSNPDVFYASLPKNDSIIIFINQTVSIEGKSNVYSIDFDFNQFTNDLKTFQKEHGVSRGLLFADSNFTYNHSINIDHFQTITCSTPYDLSTSIEFLNESDYDLIACTSLEKYESIKTAYKILRKTQKAKILLLQDYDMIYDENVIPYYASVNALVETTIGIINGDTTSLPIMLIPYIGFAKKTLVASKTSQINILMIETPSTTALLKIKPYIEYQIGFKINIDVIKYNEFDQSKYQYYIDHYDLIRVDMAYLPVVSQVLFKPLDERFKPLTKRFISDIDEYSYHHGSFYSLPFDLSCVIMLYRSDILNNQVIQRHFYEQTKNHELLPRNYQDYNEVEKFFIKNYGDIFKPSTVCFGSNLTCGNEFLLRVDPAVSQFTDPLDIDDVSIRTALDSYLNSVSRAKNLNNRFWDEVIKEYAEGQTIMSLVFTNYIHTLKTLNKELLYKTEYSIPPDNHSLIGGGVIGLSRNTTKDDLCFAFLDALYSNQISKLLTHLGATMPTKAIYNDINLISIYPWLKLIPLIIKNNTRKKFNKDGKIVDTIAFEKRIGEQVREYILSKLNL